MWEEFGEAMETDFWLEAILVQVECCQLQLVGWWREYFDDLLNPTDTFSVEELKHHWGQGH